MVRGHTTQGGRVTDKDLDEVQASRRKSLGMAYAWEPEPGQFTYNGVPLPGVACVGLTMGKVEESTEIKSGRTSKTFTVEGTFTMRYEDAQRWWTFMQGLRVYGPIWEPDTRELKAMRWLALDELDYLTHAALPPPADRVRYLKYRAHICEVILRDRGVAL